MGSAWGFGSGVRIGTRTGIRPELAWLEEERDAAAVDEGSTGEVRFLATGLAPALQDRGEDIICQPGRVTEEVARFGC